MALCIIVKYVLSIASIDYGIGVRYLGTYVCKLDNICITNPKICSHKKAQLTNKTTSSLCHSMIYQQHLCRQTSHSDHLAPRGQTKVIAAKRLIFVLRAGTDQNLFLSFHAFVMYALAGLERATPINMSGKLGWAPRVLRTFEWGPMPLQSTNSSAPALQQSWKLTPPKWKLTGGAGRLPSFSGQPAFHFHDWKEGSGRPPASLAVPLPGFLRNKQRGEVGQEKLKFLRPK